MLVVGCCVAVDNVIFSLGSTNLMKLSPLDGHLEFFGFFSGSSVLISTAFST